ncbi:MAG: radical SAM protein [Victivallaceae bacterium]|nr:radical SAM protein [Victivallaceae bacterium]
MHQTTTKQIKPVPRYRHRRIKKSTDNYATASKLSLVHLQLTGKCNLRCPFCGQWGENGYFHGKSDKSELSVAEWVRVIDEAVALGQASNTKPEFIIWGGEPLLSPAFEVVAAHINALDCKAALITNGILLKQNAETINRYITTLYVSIDGPEIIHEQVRNASGIFTKIKTGLKEIDHNRVNMVCMTTVCEDNAEVIDQIPFTAADLGFEKIIIQNLIYCSSKMADNYAAWLNASYCQTASQVKTWIIDQFGAWTNKAREQLQTIRANIDNNIYPISVIVHPDELLKLNSIDWYNSETALNSEPPYCEMPFAHLQITADGNVNFCVDFSDFSLGNVKNRTLESLWSGKEARQFREDIKTGRNPLCSRCPWFYNKQLKTD